MTDIADWEALTRCPITEDIISFYSPRHVSFFRSNNQDKDWPMELELDPFLQSSLNMTVGFKKHRIFFCLKKTLIGNWLIYLVAGPEPIQLHSRDDDPQWREWEDDQATDSVLCSNLLRHHSHNRPHRQHPCHCGGESSFDSFLRTNSPVQGWMLWMDVYLLKDIYVG